MDRLMNDDISGFGTSQDDEIKNLFKALEANQSITDISLLTGAAALQPQSLETTLAMLTWQEKNLTLWRDVPKGSAASTLEEYTVQLGMGREGGYVQQMETPVEDDPLFQRKFAAMKFLRMQWKISDVATMVNTISDAETKAKQGASLRLMRAINRSLYSSNSAHVPDAIDGFETTIKSNGSSAHVIDLRGVAPTQDVFDTAAEIILANFGNPDNAGLYCSPGGLNTLSQILKTTGASNSAQRIIQGQVGADGLISMGYGIRDIKTPFGTLIPKSDIFIASEYEGKTVPMISNPSNPGVLMEGATSVRAPLTPSIAVTTQPATVTGSKWAASGARPQGVTYKYRVSARNRFGNSAACASADAGAVVVTNGSNTVTITPNPSSVYSATCFDVYSEAVSGGTIRYIGTVVSNGLTPVTFVDLNAVIPGTTKMFLLDLTSVGESRTFMLKRLAPLYSQEFAKIGMYRWGVVNLYAVPQYYAPLRFVLIENVPVGVVSKSNLLEI